MKARAPDDTSRWTDPPRATLSQDALKRFTFNKLLVSGAQAWADRLALRDIGTGRAWTFGDLERDVGRMAAEIRHVGLRAGERVLICGSGATGVMLLLSALRAGLDAALALPALTATEIARVARTVHAAALFVEGGSAHAHSIAPLLADAMTQAPRLRLLCAAGGSIDAALPLDSLAGAVAEAPALRGEAATGAIVTLRRRADDIEPVFHRQATLIASALDFSRRTDLGATMPILSLVPPVTFAGLVAAPLSMLLSGAGLHLHPLFAAAPFVEALEACAPAVLVAPAAVAADLDAAGLLIPDYIRSLVLLTRGAATAVLRSGKAASGVPTIDFHALGERAAVTQPRLAADAVAFPARVPHIVSIDAVDILAFEARSKGVGMVEIRGAGVTGGDDWRAT